MLDRLPRCDRRLLTVLLALSLSIATTAQDRDPATADGRKAPDKSAKPADNFASVFDRLDRNKDGVLVIDELTEDQAKSFGRLLRVADGNNDKRLTRQEFLSYLQPGPAGQPETAQQRRVNAVPPGAFERFDRNRDGKLTPEEFPEQARPRITSYLKQLGKDGLSPEDFAAMYRRQQVSRGQENRGRPGDRGQQERANEQARREQFFDRLDRDKDGKLTAQEFPENSRGLFTFLARRLEKKEGESITKQEFLASMPSRPTTQRRPGPGRPGDRPRRGGPPESGRGPLLVRVLDLNRDGQISRDELARAADQFEQLDSNGDGQLDTRELFGGSRTGPRFGGRPGSRPDARPGSRPTGAQPEARPEFRPRRPDRPRRPEPAKPPETPTSKKKSGSPESRLFGRLDQNGDGAIQAAEMPATLRKRLTTFDTDGNGSVSPAEFRRGLKERPDVPNERQDR